MNDDNEPRAGSTHEELWDLTLKNIVYEQTLDALEELFNEAIALIKSTRPSTHMVTNEPEKSTDMVTTHMGFFNDEGIQK